MKDVEPTETRDGEGTQGVEVSAETTLQGSPPLPGSAKTRRGASPDLPRQNALDTLPAVEVSAEDDANDSDLPAARGDDQQTDAAVEEILRSDADTMLDEAGSPAATPVSSPPSRRRGLKAAWSAWWHNPWKKWLTIGAVVVSIGGAASIAPARAYLLNAVGVRTSAIVVVYDGASNLPLDNATIAIDGQATKTNEKGEAKMTDIRLGKHEVVISKTAFAAHKITTNFGMRIVDLGEITLKSVGTQITYTFTDYLSAKPVPAVSLSSGEATAKSDKNGKAVLTIPSGSSDQIRIQKEGYRDEVLGPPQAEKSTQPVSLVPVAQAVFVTKESGRYDVFKVHVDGKNREVLLAGSGLETDTIAAIPSPNGKIVAVSSTRDNKRNAAGYLLTALTLVNMASGEQNTVEHAEQITMLGWRGEILVYQLTSAGVSAANPARQKIIAYDTAENKRYQLANANYFVGQELIGNTVYYAISATDPSTPSSFGRVNIDASSKKTIASETIWALIRTDYNKLKFQTPDMWYEYTLGSASPQSSTPQDGYSFRYYVDRSDSKQSVRVDVRDSNGVLLLRDVAGAKEQEVATQRNMQAPLYWLTDTVVVYRVAGASEVADYAVSTAGGTPKKLSDVSLSGIR